MNLQCPTQIDADYKSASQAARALTEGWCTRELYCPACESDQLLPSRPNSPALDFSCPSCRQFFELKSSKGWMRKKIVDAGYSAMIRAIREDRTPNLFVLQYSKDWFVTNLLLIPRMFFTENAIEKRPALSPRARRAGWVGCNILLDQIPSDGKIMVVSAGAAVQVSHVREEFARVRGLAQLQPSKRGWTVEVLNLIRRLHKPEFSLAELYERESELRELHPGNKNIRPKIRQQLQILRDMRLVRFTERGKYRVA